ncbi:hypothetical protein A1D31_40245 [Bradyrhizobium liaoningense]|nr:hypothetical protein A1D31_40245 [Bradyrhizobium liaoningense]
MKDLRSILRLTYEQDLSVREISERLQISKSSVATYLLRAREAGLSWPLPPIYESQAALQRALFRRVGRPPQDLSEPEWPRVAHPDGYGYTWFCEKFEAYRRRANPTFRLCGVDSSLHLKQIEEKQRAIQVAILRRVQQREPAPFRVECHCRSRGVDGNKSAPYEATNLSSDDAEREVNQRLANPFAAKSSICCQPRNLYGRIMVVSIFDAATWGCPGFC